MQKPDSEIKNIQELELELIPESVNDDHYDGVIHISTRRRLPKFPNRHVGKRSNFQTFTFD